MLRRAALITALLLAGPSPALAASPIPVAAPGAVGAASRALTRWEYKVITYNRVAMLSDSETELRLLGYQGWELVSTVFDTNARTIVCFLKRPLPER